MNSIAFGPHCKIVGQMLKCQRQSEEDMRPGQENALHPRKTDDYYDDECVK